jgi:predicted porin
MDNATLNSLSIGDFQWDGGLVCRYHRKTYKEFYMQMQKKIIALAIASAMTVPALAYAAEATVYGQVNLSYDMVNDGAVTSAVSNNQLNSNTSRLGLKGSEDLSGGLSAIWQVEGTLGPDTGGSTLFNRNNFLGLKSNDFGSLLAGRIDTPYKTATRRLDLFGDGIADNRGSQVNGATAGTTPFTAPMMGSAVLVAGGTANTVALDARLSNSIAYISPSWSGFSVALASVFGAETAAGSTNTKKGSAYSLAGMYDQGPFYAALAYQTQKFGDATTGDLAPPAGPATIQADDEVTAMKLGGSYSTDAFMVGLAWEDFTGKDASAGSETKGTNMYFSGKFNISGTDAIKLAYTMRGETKVAGASQSNDASQVTLGYDHGMSKTTTLYALYSKETQKNATNTGFGAADPSVISLGMRHSF